MKITELRFWHKTKFDGTVWSYTKSNRNTDKIRILKLLFCHVKSKAFWIKYAVYIAIRIDNILMDNYVYMPDWKHNNYIHLKQAFNIPEVWSFEELGLTIAIVVRVERTEYLEFKIKRTCTRKYQYICLLYFQNNYNISIITF